MPITLLPWLWGGSGNPFLLLAKCGHHGASLFKIGTGCFRSPFLASLVSCLKIRHCAAIAITGRILSSISNYFSMFLTVEKLDSGFSKFQHAGEEGFSVGSKLSRILIACLPTASLLPLLFKTESPYVPQAGLQLLYSSNPPTSASSVPEPQVCTTMFTSPFYYFCFPLILPSIDGERRQQRLIFPAFPVSRAHDHTLANRSKEDASSGTNFFPPILTILVCYCGRPC